MPRRLAITGPFQAEYLDYDEPPLGATDVRVKTSLASGKIGTTTAMFDSRAFAGQRFDPDMRIFLPDVSGTVTHGPTPQNPWNMGTTGVGVITEVGADVTHFEPGARVFGLMDVRETNTVDQSKVYALGELDPMQALCIEPAYVAFHCVRESNVRYGDSVVVVGLGALGLLAVRMARESGAAVVIAVDLLESRRRLAVTYGADYAIDPRDGDAALSVHQLTDGKGADVAIELVGVYPALETAVRSVRVAGTVCSAGFYQGEAHGIYFGREWHHNRLTMIVPHGCGWGHPPRDYPRWDAGRAYDTIAHMMHRGRLNVPGLVNHTVPFSDAGQIFDTMKNQPDKIIKYAVSFQ